LTSPPSGYIFEVERDPAVWETAPNLTARRKFIENDHYRGRLPVI
jgi:hypothetical protein